MASPVEFAFCQSSSPKLPAIGDNTNLVSQPLVQTTQELKDAGGSARILEDDSVNQEKRKLKKLISRAFITALHRKNEIKCWNHLCDVLELSEPYLSLLKTKELCHYAERAYLELEGREDLENVSICLQNSFVDVIASLQKDGTRNKRKVKFPSGPVQDAPLTPRKNPVAPKGVKIPRVEPKSFVFSSADTEKQLGSADGQLIEHPKQAKKVSLNDLRLSLVEVIKDISSRESVLGVPLGMTILAVDINFPQNHLPSPPPTPKTSITKESGTDGVNKGAQTDLDDKRETVFIPRTGREIVEDFIKGNFLGKLKFAYLNLAPTMRYDPYSLIEVPKSKVNPEHFVISSHSILHVTPDGPCDTKTLSEWYIEASIFQAIMNLSFFKNFLVRKMFVKLRDAKKCTYFRKTKSELEHSLLHNVQTFGSALLRISSLLNDLSKVSFLPFDANHCYTLSEFEELTFKTSDTGRMYVNKFFGYCQMIVDKTQENCFEYLRYCEAQIKNHQHNYKESLAIAKEKQSIRQQNLKLAYEEVAKLGTFVNLVDHIIIQNLLSVAQMNICKFVDVALPGPRPDREGLFQVGMVFDDSHKLTLSPSTKHLTYSLSAALNRVLTIVCSLSHAMELGETTKSFIAQSMKNKSNAKQPKVSKSTSNPQSTAATTARFSSMVGHHHTDSWNVESQPEMDSKGHGDILRSSQEAQQSENNTSAEQGLRPEEEIVDDIQDFHASLVSARGMRTDPFEELCSKRPQETILVIEGQKVQQHGTSRSPLTREKLEEKLYNDDKIKDALKYFEEFVAESMEEVKEFCDNHDWLSEIHEFVSLWDDIQMDYWKVQPTAKIEQQLRQIHTWTEQVGNVIKSFSTANGLLYINCSEIQEIIIPGLNSIFKQMVKMIATQMLVLSEEAITEMEKLLGSVREQRTEIKAFALFILQLNKVKERVPALKDKVEYIKNLFEVIRGCYRQLTADEEIAEEKVWACWESFLFGLQEASDFIQIQKPMMIERLKETISTLEEEAFGIGHRAANGRFVDPDEVPSSVLADLRQLRERCRRIGNELRDTSVWKEVITGTPYDLTAVLKVYESVEKRLELWRYFEVSSNSIKEWLHSPFKKVPVKRVMDKINEWEAACNNLKAHIDENDNVLIALISKLQEFGQELPLLLQLSSDALKPRHWRALFIRMSQEFDPLMFFTTACLLSFNLGRYKDLISTICASAGYEHALESELHQLLKAWCDRDFKLAKYIPLMRPRISDEVSRKSGNQKDKKRKITAHEKNKTKSKPKTPATVPDVLILIGIGELKCLIEDNLVTLQSMLVSPYVVDVKALVQHWIGNLTELQDILDTWHDCQKKWLYLTNVFTEPIMAEKYADQLNDFRMIDKKYREFIDIIAKNTKVTVVLTKKRGELGWRELQGETLRLMLEGLIHAEEELIVIVKEYFEQARMAFPRLYFLSDSSLLEVLAWSRNPKDLLPFVKMCFPGMQSLQFKLPHDVSVNLTSALDAALNAHLLEVTAMEGHHGEEVSLVRTIPACPCPQKWLASLEQVMRDTLMNELAQCVNVRLEEGVTNYTKLVERMLNSGDPTSEGTITSGDDPAVERRSLLSFPAQCIDKAEDVLWARKVRHALASDRIQDLTDMRSEMKSLIEDLASAIRKSIEWNHGNQVQKRLEVILANLLTQAVNHRDTVVGLIEDRVSSVHSFEWQSQLRSEIEITEEISSSYDGKHGEDGRMSSGIPIQRNYKIGSCTLEHLGSTSVYGYEYQGPITGLVVTPLAKRCFLTLNMALQAFKCGTLHGPNGTGKTETVQHLSQILGRHLVMVNCTESLASPMVVGYLKGMLRSGSWVCLENFDCMSIGVQSALGQHLQKIWSSMKSIKRDMHSQYTVRGDTDKNKILGRRNSLVTLGPLYGDQSVWPKVQIQQELQIRRRRLSATEASNYLDIPSVDMPGPSSECSHGLEKTFQDKSGLYRYKVLSPLSFDMPLLGNIVFNNSLFAVSSMYGCFMTMSSYKNSYSKIPENLKVLLRPVAMVVPDVVMVLEITMSCCGFTEGKLLAKKLHMFFNMISDQISKRPQNDFSLRSMRAIVSFASTQLRKEVEKGACTSGSSGDLATDAPVRSPFLESFERRQTEENALVYGLFTFFGNKLLDSDKEVFSMTVDTVFIHSVLMSVVSEGEPLLFDEIKEYFVSHRLQIRTDLITKTVQLYKSVQSSRKVILTGSSGSGKTTLHQALTGAINSLHAQSADSAAKRRVSNRPIDPQTEDPQTNSKAWPMLDVTVVYPKSLTNDELFGYRDQTTSAWRDGLISKFFRDSTLTSRMKKDLLDMTPEEKQRAFRGMRDLSVVEKWLVLDGPMDDLWLGSMSTVLDNTKALSLGDGGSITVPDTVSIVFETTNMSNVSPSLVTCCSIVHCPDDLVGWKSILRSWIKFAHSKWEISSRGLGVISCLADHAVEKTLVFLEQHCKTVLIADYGSPVPPSGPARGIHEIQSLLRYLSAIFDRFILREVDDRQVQVMQQQKGRASVVGSVHSRHSSGISAWDTDKVISTFAFAFVWAFGGHLQDRFAESFDEHARQVLSSGPYPASIPVEGLVYDYYIDFLKGALVRWAERPTAQFKTFAASYTVVPEIDRYFFLVDLMISAGQPVVLVGEPGAGKSALMQNLVSPRHSYHRISMSAGMSSKLFQEVIEAKLAQVKRRDLKEKAVQVGEARTISDVKSKSILFFLDDLNYANVDKNDVQPPLELLRQLINLGCLYNRDRQQFHPVKNIQLICTAVPPGASGVGGGVASHILSPSLTRLMTVLSFFPVSSKTLTVIYSGIFRGWLKGFPAYSITHHVAVSEALAKATVQLYTKIREELRPSPFHPQLLFNQHHLAHVVQSMTLFSASSRARPRPRPRKRGGRTEDDACKETKANSDRRAATKSKQVKEEKSVVTDEKRLSTIMTPAVLSPIIRTLFRLWCHENTRTYCDRLLNDDQRYSFASLLHDHVMEHFCDGVESQIVEMQTEVKRLFPEMSEESFGLGPGTNAPPPSAKVSRCSDFHEKTVHKVEVELDVEIEAHEARGSQQSESQNNDFQEVESKIPENLDVEVCAEKEVNEGGERNLRTLNKTDEIIKEENADEIQMTDNTDEMKGADEIQMTDKTDEMKGADEIQMTDNTDEMKGTDKIQMTDKPDVIESTDKVDVADEFESHDAVNASEKSERCASSVDGHRIDDEHTDQAVCTFSAQAPGNKVTFGISMDEDKQEYTGPLITLDQLVSPGEDLTDIVFCKHFNAASVLATAASSSSVVRGYVECSSESLEQGMHKCLASYNSKSSQEPFKKINMVTFREALCHAAHISRALTTEGGHALLLSHEGYGRRTLTRLAAHAAGFKLIEVQSAAFQSQGDLRQQIKEASYIAGLQGKPVVLFVPEDQGDHSLQDICTLMVEGTCPGLYTMNELNMISSNLLPVGQRGAWRAEHQDIAQERFYRRVKSHLHVVFCLKHLPLNPTLSPLQSKLYRFPTMLSRCLCVDIYRPWPHHALASIAEKLLDVESPEFDLVPWKTQERVAQSSAICSIMAHVHLSSRSMAQKLYGVKGLKLYSPDSYLDFVYLFKKLCERLCVNEKVKICRLKNGIIRMEEASDTIEKLNNELAELAPICEEAHNAVKQCHERVDSSQKEYQDQKEACKQQEAEIVRLQGPVQTLKKETSEEFGKVSPLFAAACLAINSLDVHDVEEIRSYRMPPLLVELVVNSICLLFQKEQNWKEGKVLLNRDNFFKDLEFYDMKGMPDSMFANLKVFYKDPSFNPEIVTKGSAAAGSLCMWVRAVYDYCVVYRALKPKRRKLKRAEAELEKAKTLLGELRVRCNQIKKELEENIQAYKDSVKHLKNTEKKIQTIEDRKSRALNLFTSMTEYYESWKKTLTESEHHLATSPGDALIAAASVCYLGALNWNAREELLTDWLRVCDGTKRELPNKRIGLASMILRNPGLFSTHLEDAVKPSKSTLSSTVSSSRITVRSNISLPSLLVEQDELGEWMRNDLPSNGHALQNAVIMRTCYDRTHSWPLLIDPHGQAEMWVRAVTEEAPGTSADLKIRPKSRASGRSGSTGVSTPLDYQLLDEPEEDENSAADVSVNDTADSDVFGGGDTPTDPSFDISDKTLKERIAKELGFQFQSPDLPSIITATPNLEVNEGQVVVIPADDSQIVSKIRVAVMSGVVVLITHMERRRLSKKLELLLSRQTFTDDQNATKILIGKSTVSCHPSFRLFLSSSVPLFMPGEGLVPLPLSKTCVIDMSLSQEGLTDRLMRETLSLERPEYEGQQRSLDRDLTLHKQQIVTAQVFVLEKVLDLKTALLKDPNMLVNVHKAKDLIKTAGGRYDEALTMKKQMLEKRDDFLPVARYGAMLYMIICQMHKVQPLYYHITMESYLRIFRETIFNRKRNKKSLGSPAARAAELISALSRMVYTRISWGLFLSDNLLFPFLISIEKLFNEGGITEDEWKLFIFHSPLPKRLTTAGKDPNKPSWITQEAWHLVEYLQLLPSLKDLQASLIEYWDEWREYFSLPPVLLANTPGELPPLTVFQKALLWRVFREDQVHQICQDLVLYILGATMVHPVEYDIHQVYTVCNNATPMVFLLPSHEAVANGASISIKDPFDGILNLAQTHNKSMSMMNVSLGEPNSMVHALDAVRRGMDCGYWVVINNAHLAEEWPREFIETLQIITSNTPLVEDSDEDEGSYSFWAEDADSRSPNSRNRSIVHPEFRLFVTTRVGSGRPLPAALIQRGLKLACESKAAGRSTVRQAFEVAACTVQSWTSYWKQPFSGEHTIKSSVPQYALYALAYLHSVLHHRRIYGSSISCPYEWSYADLHGSGDLLRHLCRSCVLDSDDSSKGIALKTLLDVVACVVYSGHVIDKQDFTAVRSLAQSLQSSQELRSVLDSSDNQSVEERLEHFPERLSIDQLGVVRASARQHSFQRSRLLRVDLRTSMELKTPQFPLEEAVDKLNQVKNIIAKLTSNTSTSEPKENPTAVESFFFKELLFYQEFLCEITKDIHLLWKVTEGQIANTPYLHTLLVDLYFSRVPRRWYKTFGGPVRLAWWLESLSSSVVSVMQYSMNVPPVVHLGSLVHQQAYFSCVMIDHVKFHKVTPHSLVFEMQVMFEPKTTTPGDGIYLSGLSIHNASWDYERCCVIGGTDNVTALPIVLLTLHSPRQRAVPESDLLLYNCPLITQHGAASDYDELVTSLSVFSVLTLEELQKRQVKITSSLVY